MRALISNSDLCVQDNLGCTALDVAAAGNHLKSETVRLLAQTEREPVNTPNNKGDSDECLLEASRSGCVREAQKLLDAGTNVDTCSNGVACKGTVGERGGRTPLSLAFEGGHPGIVKMLLSHGADPNSADDENSSPLHAATLDGHIDVVRHLLTMGADLNLRDTELQAPLCDAALEGCEDVVECLLEAGADPDAANSTNRMPLFDACSNGHNGVVQSLLAAGADLNARDDTGRTPIFEACSNGWDGVVRELISNSDLRVRNNLGCTALDVATAGDHLNSETVRLLTQNERELVNTPNNKGDSDERLLEASRSGRVREVQKLLDAGANVDTCSNGVACKGTVGERGGGTPLSLACEGGHLGVVKMLLSRGADPNAADDEHSSPLHAAALDGHIDVVRHLLTMGADPNLRDTELQTPLCDAALEGHGDIVECLLEAGADPDVTDSTNQTPLFDACTNGRNGVVQSLLAAGADPNARDDTGRTPLSEACSNGRDAVVRELISNSDLRFRDNLGCTALDVAAAGDHLNSETVRLLAQNERGLVNTPNNKGEIPLHIAAEMGDFDTALALAGSNVFATAMSCVQHSHDHFMRNESHDVETNVSCETVSPFSCDIVSHEKCFVCHEPLGSVAICKYFRSGQSLSDTWAWWHL